MKDFITILCHARRFKSSVKDLSIEQLKEVRRKLDTIIEDRTRELEELRNEEIERLEKIKKIQEMMIAEGIDAVELQSSLDEKNRKRPPRPPKYEIWNEAGQRVTWTGQGRMPNLLKNRIEEGEELETFLID